MATLLNLIYVALLISVSPMLLYRRLVQGKYRDGWTQKLWGHLPRFAPDRPVVWIHAVSVGEVLQLRRIIERFERDAPEWQILVTTTTSTGFAVASEQFGTRATVAYFPLDFSWSVRRALSRVAPQLIVLVELELWPNFIRQASSRSIPLTIINGRLSERSFRGYRRIRPLIARLLNRFSWIGVQNLEYGERFRQLGAPLDRLAVTGSIKFDHLSSDRRQDRTRELREDFEIDESDPVLVVGSTQSPEEWIGLNCYGRLLSEFPNLRLILVPRHQERFAEVASLVRKAGYPLRRRTTHSVEPLSDESSRNDRRPVLLLDTLGELSACWGLADLAFVGGSLSRRGGQNMMEPAAFGAAILVGPNTRNFRDVVDMLQSAQALEVVRDESEMYDCLRKLLLDPSRRQWMGARAAALVARQQGALDRTMVGLKPLLDSKPPRRSGRAA